MKQTWHDLLFAHWPVPPGVLRPLVPHELSLDTYGGRCWVGAIPFRMNGIQRRGFPPLPGLSRFPELNVRTYVTHGDKAGVYFFSLDAANLAAVWAARGFYYLAYFHAAMKCEGSGEHIRYVCGRYHSSAEFRGSYAPTGDVRLRQMRIDRALAYRTLLPVHDPSKSGL